MAENFVERMIDESSELTERLNDALRFRSHDNRWRQLSAIEQHLLNEQITVMTRYKEMLDLRISLYTGVRDTGELHV